MGVQGRGGDPAKNSPGLLRALSILGCHCLVSQGVLGQGVYHTDGSLEKLAFSQLQGCWVLGLISRVINLNN